MPRPVDEDRARRRELLEQKRAARKISKEKEEELKRLKEKEERDKGKKDQSKIKNHINNNESTNGCLFLTLPDDAVHVIYSMLSASDLGRIALTCKQLNIMLSSARILYLLTRLSSCHGPSQMNICNTEQEINELLENAIVAGGDTGRIIPKGKYAQQTHNEFVSYARFLEEAVCGYSHLSTSNKHNDDDDDGEMIYLPRHIQGRFVSCSPEHTICRVGGDGQKSGAGGSGVASWGIGKRGQLGHNKREDERYPKRIIKCIHSNIRDNNIPPTLGYGIRIVQVSAGGGLVRVAHTLLLTSTGRVMSFGTGQYGALGHGFSAAKQLPDILQPTFIEGPLRNVKCTCVAAGELHSAAVTSDGDVYTWGDGFCGQLGHGDKRPQLIPKQVTTGDLADEVVTSISCGCRHSLAVTEDGEVFSWGLGHYGVLGRSFDPFEYDAQTAVNNFAAGGGDDDDNNDFHLLPDGTLSATAPVQATVVERDFAAELAAHLDLIASVSLDDSSNQCFPKVIDSLKGICIIGSSAGHRHSLVLDASGALYSFGSGNGGCLGHGNTAKQMFPCRIQAFDEENVRIHQFSAGVDISMAVSTAGDVYGWGKTDGGRIGLGMTNNNVTLPRRVYVQSHDPIDPSKSLRIKAVDVECGYVHSLVVGLNGTLHQCGGVGVEGEADGQNQENYGTGQQEFNGSTPVAEAGRAREISEFNIWHRLPEPTEHIHRTKWKKYGKYEVKGRSKMMSTED